ncbi:hypothetical protein D3C71_1584710 [compost metagenome]
MGNVRNGIVVTGQISAICQHAIQHRERVFGKTPISVDGAGNGFRRKELEVHALAQHRPHAGGMKLQPLDCFPAGKRVRGQQLACLIGQVQQNGRGFKKHHARLAVRHHGNAAMRVQRKKVWLAMLAFIDAHVVQAIRQGKLFKCNACLEAIGRAV